MTIVRNYSELSAAQRDVLAGAEVDESGDLRISSYNRNGTRTLDVLERKGFVEWQPAPVNRYRLTEAGLRARDHFLADVPPKIAIYLDRAREIGLNIERSEDSGTLKSWTVSSPLDWDNSQVWLYWSPGARGGRVSMTYYPGPHGRTQRNQPLRYIRYHLEGMGDTIRRAAERDAARKAQEHADTQKRVADAQAALAEVFAEMDAAAAIDRPVEENARNLLHEELNLSIVHIGDEDWQPLCRPHGVLTSDMTLVSYAADCAACLALVETGRATPADSCATCWPRPCDTGRSECRSRVLACGCPAQIVTDEGHQEGCSWAHGDPKRPGWFMIGQHIFDHDARVHAEVVHVQHGANGDVEAVAVTTNGGYGREWFWYGKHALSLGGLDRLEGPHVGLTDYDRRSWPSLPTARTRVGLVLHEQKLSGWVASDHGTGALLVNLPAGVDPVRHVILLERYIPYRCTVQLRTPRPNAGIVGDTIIIRPKGD